MTFAGRFADRERVGDATIARVLIRFDQADKVRRQLENVHK
jgi:hypothetical protein